jgi:hypothetical protein
MADPDNQYDKPGFVFPEDYPMGSDAEAYFA